jgi:putative DNA-invertase from lambdoid prophage Rac
MKVAVYTRVSTDNQDTANQTAALTGFIAARNFDVVKFYQENESAWGKKGYQSALAKLIDDAAKRKFDAVVVWSLDRLSRAGASAILQLFDRLKIYGVRIISYQESWTEVDGALVELLYAISGWVAKYESDRRSERTKAALDRLKAQGKKLGRPAGSKDKKKRKKRTIVNA